MGKGVGQREGIFREKHEGCEFFKIWTSNADILGLRSPQVKGLSLIIFFLGDPSHLSFPVISTFAVLR